MRNLGPVTERRLAEIGIYTEDDLRGIGAVAAYLRMRFVSPRSLSLNALHAMEAALLGCDWRDLDPGAKQRLNDAVAEAERRAPRGGSLPSTGT
jgi:DNA transformation protein